MKSCSEACIFISYPNGTRGGLFYSPKNTKVFVSTNATFLENDYMQNCKPKSEVIIEEVTGETSTPSAPSVEPPIIDDILPDRIRNVDTLVPKIVLQQQAPNIGGALVANISILQPVPQVGILFVEE